MTRTAEQQAAYDRMVGTAQTVRDQMDAGVIADDRTPATVVDAEDVYTVTTSAGARVGFSTRAIRDTRADAIDVANRLHAHRVANGAEGIDSVRVERNGVVIWAIRDNGTIIH